MFQEGCVVRIRWIMVWLSLLLLLLDSDDAIDDQMDGLKWKEGRRSVKWLCRGISRNPFAENSVNFVGKGAG